MNVFRTGLIAVVVALGLTSIGLAQAPQPNQPPQPGRPGQPPGAHQAMPEQNNPALAQLRSIQWEKGPKKVAIGGQATIQVPEGYQFTGAAGAQKLMQLNGNQPRPSTQGILSPVPKDGVAGNEDWLILFEYDDCGYVKDDEKDKIDANALLQSIRDGTEHANQERAKQGIPPMQVVGWDKPPTYDTKTNRLVWAVRGRSEGSGDVLNYNSRILGRSGVMSANLIVEPEALPKTLPVYESLLNNFAYNDGQKYAEFKPGDKVAEYGLAALVLGGGAALAAKTGLLAKLGILFAKFAKFIIIGVVLLLSPFIWLFNKITGRGQAAPTDESPSA